MTLTEAINRLDSLKSNTYTQDDKVQWLSRLDGMVKRTIIDTHEGGEAVVFGGYTADMPMSTELLVKSPFDEMYIRWMEAQIDYFNGEYGKYNNSITMFNADFNAYKNYYNRSHKPIGKHFSYF